jgi:CheY-like chemotaxis protein
MLLAAFGEARRVVGCRPRIALRNSLLRGARIAFILESAYGAWRVPAGRLSPQHPYAEEKTAVTSAAYCPRCQSTIPPSQPGTKDPAPKTCPRCGSLLDAEAGREAPAAAPSHVILCIDDDRLLLSMLCDALEAEGYRTLLATDGPSGIETAKNARPDLILLDVVMPGMTGLEVCRRLRATAALRDTPIVLLTAADTLGLDVEGQEAGATLVLRKPFGPAAVLAALQGILGGPPRRRKRSRTL